MKIDILTDPAAAPRVAALINEVYAVAEEGIWLDDARRTTADEVAGFIRDGQLVAAWLDDEIVGCLRLQQLDDATSEFGMFAADPARRGLGIGRELVRFAEETARGSVMQLEVLVPREWTHPSKKFVAEWYTRMGYRVTRTGTIDEDYPHLAPLLATPCDFVIYHKDLTA